MCSLQPQLYGREEKELSCRAAFPHSLFSREDAGKSLRALFRIMQFREVWSCLSIICLPFQALPLLSLAELVAATSKLDIVPQCSEEDVLHGSSKWHLNNMHFSACCVKMCVLCHISGAFLYFTYFCFFSVTHPSQWHSLQFLNDHFRTLLFLFFFYY